MNKEDQKIKKTDDDDLAFKIRTLRRQDFYHHEICCAASDRILILSKQVKELRGDDKTPKIIKEANAMAEELKTTLVGFQDAIKYFEVLDENVKMSPQQIVNSLNRLANNHLDRIISVAKY